MQLMLIAMMGAVLVSLAYSPKHLSIQTETNPLLVQAQGESQLLYTMEEVAKVVIYKTPFTSTTPVVRTWQEIRNNPNAPPFAKTTVLPANWKISGTSSKWAICAPVSSYTQGKVDPDKTKLNSDICAGI